MRNVYKNHNNLRKGRGFERMQRWECVQSITSDLDMIWYSFFINWPSREANAEDLGSVPGLGRSLGEENGNPLQYSCLENSMDRGTWWATVHGVAKSQTRLSNQHYTLLAFLLPRWPSGKEPTCQCRRHKRCKFDPWVRKISSSATEKLWFYWNFILNEKRQYKMNTKQ